MTTACHAPVKHAIPPSLCVLSPGPSSTSCSNMTTSSCFLPSIPHPFNSCLSSLSSSPFLLLQTDRRWTQNRGYTFLAKSPRWLLQSCVSSAVCAANTVFSKKTGGYITIPAKVYNCMLGERDSSTYNRVFPPFCWAQRKHHPDHNSSQLAALPTRDIPSAASEGLVSVTQSLGSGTCTEINQRVYQVFASIVLFQDGNTVQHKKCISLKTSCFI